MSLWCIQLLTLAGEQLTGNVSVGLGVGCRMCQGSSWWMCMMLLWAGWRWGGGACWWQSGCYDMLGVARAIVVCVLGLGDLHKVQFFCSKASPVAPLQQDSSNSHVHRCIHMQAHAHST